MRSQAYSRGHVGSLERFRAVVRRSTELSATSPKARRRLGRTSGRVLGVMDTSPKIDILKEDSFGEATGRAYALWPNPHGRGVDLEGGEERLRAQRVEDPFLGYGDTGTRFAVFPRRRAPRPLREGRDAAETHKHTGICPSVAIHIPWDKVDDYSELQRPPPSLWDAHRSREPEPLSGAGVQARSVCHPTKASRRKATDHILECIRVAGEVARACSPVVRRRHELSRAGLFVERRHRCLRAWTRSMRRCPRA